MFTLQKSINLSNRPRRNGRRKQTKKKKEKIVPCLYTLWFAGNEPISRRETGEKLHRSGVDGGCLFRSIGPERESRSISSVFEAELLTTTALERAGSTRAKSSSPRRLTFVEIGSGRERI